MPLHCVKHLHGLLRLLALLASAGQGTVGDSIHALVVAAAAGAAAAGVGVVVVLRWVLMVWALLRCRVVERRWMQ